MNDRKPWARVPGGPFRAWRQRMGYTQADAAIALGLTPRHVNRYDRDELPIGRKITLAMEAVELRPLIAPLIANLGVDDFITAGTLSPLGAILANGEGWNLFWIESAERLEIQRLDTDNPPFLTDLAALHHVRAKAGAGSALHLAALSLHMDRRITASEGDWNDDIPHDRSPSVRVPRRLWDETMFALHQALGQIEVFAGAPDIVTQQIHEFGQRVLTEARRRAEP